MSLPGFMRLSGSQRALNSRKACMSSGPNIFGQQAARAWPSPCSPLSEPPKLEHHIGGAIEEFAEVAQALLSAKVEVDAQVYAALAVVAVERAAVAVFGHERGELRR